AVVLRIPDPVVDPLVGRLVTDVLERLTERATRSELRSLPFADDVAALAADRLDDLLAVLRVAVRRILHRELVLLGVREQVRGDRVDLRFVPGRVLRRAVVGVVEEARHPGRRLDRLWLPY